MLMVCALFALCGLLLGYSSIRFRLEGDPLIDKIDELLPQIQCGQCHYPGCRPYASAVTKGEADINQCPPGGEETMIALAALLGVDPKPLKTELEPQKSQLLAVIDEDICIGCTLCVQACPVDAIVGAAKLMHTVIARECTGCELCLPPCPVDCISLIPVSEYLSIHING